MSAESILRSIGLTREVVVRLTKRMQEEDDENLHGSGLVEASIVGRELASPKFAYSPLEDDISFEQAVRNYERG